MCCGSCRSCCNIADCHAPGSRRSKAIHTETGDSRRRLKQVYSAAWFTLFVVGRKTKKLTGGCHAGEQKDHAHSEDADEERKVADQHEAALHQDKGKECADACKTPKAH